MDSEDATSTRILDPVPARAESAGTSPASASPGSSMSPSAEGFLQSLWDPRTARVLSTALLFLLALGFLHAARETLTLFLFAVLFAYFLAPLVGRLEKPLKGRGRAIIAVYLVLGVSVALVVYAAGPRIAEEARSLMTSLPGLSGKLASGELVGRIGHRFHWADTRSQQVQAFLTSHRDDILQYGKNVGARVAAPVQKIWWLILIPILSLFFLREGESIAAGTIDLGRNTAERMTLRGLLNDVNEMLGSYIRSQIILACLTLVAYTLVLSLLKVPYAFVLGPLAGFLEFIPVVGPAIAALSVLVISAVGGYSHVGWLVAFLGVWRLTQDYVSAPRIMGKSLEINPLMQIFAVLAGAEIGGVVGALISVPVVALLRILWRRIVTRVPSVQDAEMLHGGATG